MKPAWGLLLLTCFWGTSFALIRQTVTLLPGFQLVAIRFLVGILVLLPIMFLTGGFKAKIPLKIWFSMGTMMFLGFALQTLGLKYTTASRSAFFTGTSVLMIPIIEGFFSKKKISKKLFVSLALVCLGITIMSWQELFAPISSDASTLFWGDLITLACSLSLAFHVVFVARYSAHFPPIAFAFWQLVAVSGLAFLCHLLFESSYWPLTPPMWGAILYLGVFITAIITVLQFHFQSKISGFKAGLIYASEPVFATLFSMVYEGTHITWYAAIGGLLMLLGSLVSL